MTKQKITTTEAPTFTTDLTVRERFALMSILPKQGNILTLRTISELREQLIFSDEEQKQCGMQTLPDGQVTWDVESATARVLHLSINKATCGLIVSALKKLEDKETLTMQHVPLWDKFVKE